MNRIAEAFARLKREGKGGFIPFITAGDPDIAATSELLVELANAGADVIELGVPFSDPLADGPTIQRASERALKNGATLSRVIDLVRQIRDAKSPANEVPIVLFSYYNPLLQYGVDRLAREAKHAGVDGILVTDLIPEEAEEFAATLKLNELNMIFLVAPTSTDDRLRKISAYASGFVYAVSRTGVTGARENLSDEAELLVARMRKFCSLPVAVGFGISNAEQVQQTLTYADAAVVGSAIVKRIEECAGRDSLVAEVGQFVRSLLPKAAKVA